jgi:hypothetical protein
LTPSTPSTALAIVSADLGDVMIVPLPTELAVLLTWVSLFIRDMANPHLSNAGLVLLLGLGSGCDPVIKIDSLRGV